eukprot:COSAG01_NODE_601_length_14954_cov_175.954359_16_plen_98_part_00
MQACTRIYDCYEDLSQTEYMSIHSRRPPACALCVLISFIYSLRLTNNPIKGPPLGVSACPHNEMPLVGLTPDVCVCGLVLSLSITVVSPEDQRHSSS